MKKLLLYAAMFAAVVCCTPKEDPEEPVDPVETGEVEVFSATIEEEDVAETKTYNAWQGINAEGKNVYNNFWETDDKVSINGLTSKPLDSQYNGTKRAQFKLNQKTQTVKSSFRAAYPASRVRNFDASTGTATITIPTTQTYVSSKYDPSAYIMLSNQSNSRLQFRAQVGILMVTPTAPTGETKKIRSVKIEGMNGEYLSGDFTTDYNSLSGGSETYVQMTPAGGGFGYPMFFCIPAGTYSNGLRITITTTDSQTMIVSKQSAITIAANGIYSVTTPPFEHSTVTASCVPLTSSSISVSWQSAAGEKDQNKAWRINVSPMTGGGASVDYDIPKNTTSIWNGASCSFVVGGLTANKQYVVTVTDLLNGKQGKDLPTTYNTPTNSSEVAQDPKALPLSITSTGVQLVEDFSQISWSSSPITSAAGFFPSGYTSSTFSNISTSEASFVNYSGGVQLSSPDLDIAIAGSRLANWLSQGQVRANPGYLTLGSSLQAGYVLTPAFAIPSGKTAVVKLRVSAARASDSSAEELAAAVIQNAGASGRTSSLTWMDESNEKFYTTSSISNVVTSASSNWQTIEFSGLELVNGDRIVIGSVKDADVSDNKQLFYLNSVVVEVTSIIDHAIYDTATLNAFRTAVAADASINGTVTRSFTYSGSWGTPIGTFSGTLEGNGYTITGLDAPLIDNLIGGTIQNLTLNSTITDTSTSGFTGMFVNTMDRSDHATEDGKLNTYPLLDHCISQGSITANPSSSLTGQKGIAGLVGVVGTVDEANVDNGHFTNCTNEATVSFSGTNQHSKKIWVGGIVARHRMGKTVNDCTNSGNVSSSANSTDEIYVGGLIGSARGYGGSGRVNLRRCTNTGTVTNTGVGTSNGFPSVGGLIGYSSNRVTVQYTSKNEGSILEASNSKYVSVGGITGQTTNEQVRLAGTNSGTITIVGSHCRPYVGGIVGFLSQGSLVDDSHYASNSGNIVINSVTIADDGATKGCYYIGGLIGYFDYATDQTFSYLSFTGQIKTANTTCSDVTCTTASENIIFVGGIAAGGENTSGKQFSNCTVTQTGANTSFSLYCNVKLVLGGIVGQSALCPTNCSVNCDMTIRRTDTTAGTESNIGGIVGNCDAATYSNLLYEGTLDARNDDTSTYTVANLGGIVGVGPDAAVTLSNCAVGGSVKGSKSGNVCGLFIQAQSTSNTVTFDTTSPCKVKTGTYHYGKNSNEIIDNSKLSNNIVRGTRASSTVTNLSSIVVTSPISL